MAIYMDLDALNGLARWQGQAEAALRSLDRDVYGCLDRRLLLDLERYGISSSGVQVSVDEVARGLAGAALAMAESSASLRQHTNRAWTLVSGGFRDPITGFLIGQSEILRRILESGDTTYKGARWIERVIRTGPAIFRRVKTWRPGGHYGTAGYGVLGLVSAAGAVTGRKGVELAGRWGQMGIMGGALMGSQSSILFKGIRKMAPVGVALGTLDVLHRAATWSKNDDPDKGWRMASSVASTLGSAAFMIPGPVGLIAGVGLTGAALAIDTGLWVKDWVQANPEKVQAIKDTGKRIGKAVTAAVLRSPQVKLAGRVAAVLGK